MNKPLVSVVVITYNHEPYIRECLDGIISQKTDFPIEILVNDDCSTDNTASIIKEYENKYPSLFRCQYQTENQYSKGIHPWFDILFPIVEGTYITLCEGDDYWIDPYKLQKQVNFIKKHNDDYIAVYHNAFQEFNGFRKLFISPDIKSGEINITDLLNEWRIPTASLLYNREKIKNNSFQIKKYVNGDYALELLLMSQGRFYYDQSVMSIYRMHNDSVSANLNRDPINSYYKLISLLDDIKELYNEYDQVYFEKAKNKYYLIINEIEVLSHPLKKWFNRKTYTRKIKEIIKRIFNLY